MSKDHFAVKDYLALYRNTTRFNFDNFYMERLLSPLLKIYTLIPVLNYLSERPSCTIPHFIMDSLSCDVYDPELMRLCEEIEEDEELCEAAQLVSQLHREASSQIGRGIKRTAAVLDVEKVVTKKPRHTPAPSEPVASTSSAAPAPAPVASSSSAAPAPAPVASSSSAAPAPAPVASSSSAAPAPAPVASTSSAPAPNITVSTNNNDEIKCSVCNKFVSKRYYQNHLRSNIHKNNVLKADLECDNVKLIENAFKNRVATYRVLFEENIHQPYVPEVILQDNKRKVFALLDRSLANHFALKVNFILNADFTQECKHINNTFDFQLSNNIIDSGSNKDDIFEIVVQDILTKLSNFQRKDSGWSLVKFNYLDVNVNKFNPLCGSSFIELPRDIKNKNAVINVKNRDHECFKWAILSGLYPPANHRANETNSYKEHKNKLNFKNLPFPLKIGDIHKFENVNDIRI
ncbi:uncharacterized protein LOC125229815 [Leguminivora glycinivorella]|uniref:uncharacterized protein LOC125229815 n=1 Tax=Leguminivora glycinivorella TaxID=1035111 RepID=UPI00200EBC35|nr:uncharacterized protein LOC125229815 [Leguminivora glycinivorella]